MTTPAPTAADDQSPRRSILAYHRPRGLLALAVVVNFAIFWWVGGLLNIPEALYFDPMLPMQGAPVVAFLAAGVTLILCTLIGTLIAGTVRTDAGFFSACVGMGALAIRFGPAGQIYREAESAGVFLWLAVETALFAALVAGAWFLQRRLHRMGLSVDDQVRDGMTASTYPLGAQVLATGTHVAATCLLLLLLLRSNDKAQALASIAAASLIGSLVAHSLFNVTPSVWMWSAPAVAGIIGYIMGFSTPGDWVIGHPGSALARAIPLDYLTAGPGGALVGYWISRKWHAARQHEVAARNTAAVSAGRPPHG